MKLAKIYSGKKIPAIQNESTKVQNPRRNDNLLARLHAKTEKPLLPTPLY